MQDKSNQEERLNTAVLVQIEENLCCIQHTTKSIRFTIYLQQQWYFKVEVGGGIRKKDGWGG
jgi:hypothetical protein